VAASDLVATTRWWWPPASPRVCPKFPGIHPKVLSYLDVLRHQKPVGQRVVIIGAGGIGFDVAEYLVHNGHSTSLDGWIHRTGLKNNKFLCRILTKK
jgi:hypothetical protein